jgi:hypothetical protein
VAIAHGVRQHIVQRGRDQVVQRCRVLRQGQVEHLFAQGVGDRLPDRPRGQRSEVAGDAVHERVCGVAERHQLILARRARVRLAHSASIRSQWTALPRG